MSLSFKGRIYRDIWRQTIGCSQARRQVHYAARPHKDAVTEPDRNAGRASKQADLSNFFNTTAIRADLTSKIDARSSSSKPSHEIVRSSTQAVESFCVNVSSGNADRIIAGYVDLLRAYDRHRDSLNMSSSDATKLKHSFPLRKDNIQTAIRCLIRNARTQGTMDRRSHAAIQQMFHDMAGKFGYRHGPTDLHYYLQSFCIVDTSGASSHDPVQVFEDLRAKHPDWRTSSVEWNLVAFYLGKQRQYARACQLYEDMKQNGTKPETDILVTMTRLHLRNNNVEQAALHLDSIEANSSSNIKILTAAVAGYCHLYQSSPKQRPTFEARLRKYAQQLQSMVQSYTPTNDDRAAWHALMQYESLLWGHTQALKTVKQVAQSGVVDADTITYLLRMQVDALQNLENCDEAIELLDKVREIDLTGRIQPNDEAYYTLLSALLGRMPEMQRDLQDDAGSERHRAVDDEAIPTPNQIREARMLYDQLRVSGTRLSSRAVTPLLKAYCEAFLPYLSEAMSLVKNLFADQRSYGNTSESTTSPFALSQSTIALIFNTCVQLRDIKAAQDLSVFLLKFEVGMDAKAKLQAARSLITIANSWQEAFAFYQNIGQLPLAGKARDGYDESGYVTLLGAFRKLSCIDEDAAPESAGLYTAAPPEYMLCILEDMKQAGYQPSCVVYTTILDYYSKLATPSFEGVQATHNLLKRDEKLQPDLPLINALMNAYNRAREPYVVMAIWDRLMATRQEIDGVTLSIFFDTCGRNSLLQRARNAVASVQRLDAKRREVGQTRSFRPTAMNKGAWDSYLECLARCGKLEEAIGLLFGEMRTTLMREAMMANDLAEDTMPKGGDPATWSLDDLLHRQTQAPVRTRTGQLVGPDAKTLSTMLRFAAGARDKTEQRALHSIFTSRPADKSSTEDRAIWHDLRQRIRKNFSWQYKSVQDVGDPDAESSRA